MAIYTSTSSYFTTNLNQSYLDIFQNRPIPRSIDDIYFTINQTYQYRPNTLTAPPWDFSVNTNIYVPKLDTLRSALGF
jgi:hypothetical protein